MKTLDFAKYFVLVIVFFGIHTVAKASDEDIFKTKLITADQGDAEAQSAVAVMYLTGKGTAKDVDKAFIYFQKSAEQGDAEGQAGLGYLYSRGIGTAKDYEKAFTNLSLAAEQGNSKGLTLLGMMYYYGDGKSKDTKKSFEYFSKAADANDPYGQLMIGESYLTGSGVSSNFDKAFENFSKSARQGNPEAQYYLALSYFGEYYGGRWYMTHQTTQQYNDYTKSYMWMIIAEMNGYKDTEILKKMVANHKMNEEDINKAAEMATKCLTSKYKECD